MLLSYTRWLRPRIFFLLLTVFTVVHAQGTYYLDQAYLPSNFQSLFKFDDSYDKTNGHVQYVNESVAIQRGYFKANPNSVYIGADHSGFYPKGGRGRPSVRLVGIQNYTHGLIVADITHMPNGCGLWPAFWSNGPDWPNNGEIDIIEGANQDTKNSMALHTSRNCTIAGAEMTGTLKRTDCAYYPGYNAGCGIGDTNTLSYGPGFNDNGGGVYATEWTSNFIKIWFFPRGSIPETITRGDENPDVSTFGLPVARFQGSCNIDSKFNNHHLVININFCGDWAGNAYAATTCPKTANVSGWDSCVNWVGNNPQNMTEAYWEFKSINIYQQVPPVSSVSMPPQSSVSPILVSSEPAGPPPLGGGGSVTLSSSPSLVLATSSIVPEQSGVADCPAGNQTRYSSPAGAVYQIECGWDHASGDLPSPNPVYVNSFPGCIDACDARAGCVQASWNAVGGACYLKGSVGRVLYSNGVWGARQITAGTIVPVVSSSSVPRTSSSTVQVASSSPRPVSSSAVPSPPPASSSNPTPPSSPPPNPVQSTFSSAVPTIITNGPVCPEANLTTYITNDKQFYVECGFAHAGCDMTGTGLVANTLQACIDRCALRTGCVKAEYSGGRCYEKSCIGTLSYRTSTSGARYMGMVGGSGQSSSVIGQLTSIRSSISSTRSVAQQSSSRVDIFSSSPANSPGSSPAASSPGQYTEDTVTSSTAANVVTSQSPDTTTSILPPVPSALVCPERNQTSYETVNGTYRIDCGINYGGTDISGYGEQEPNFQACVNICVQLPTCSAVTYWNGRCYPKSAVRSQTVSGSANGAFLISRPGAGTSSSRASAVSSSRVATSSNVPVVSRSSSTVVAPSSSIRVSSSSPISLAPISVSPSSSTRPSSAAVVSSLIPASSPRISVASSILVVASSQALSSAQSSSAQQQMSSSSSRASSTGSIPALSPSIGTSAGLSSAIIVSSSQSPSRDASSSPVMDGSSSVPSMAISSKFMLPSSSSSGQIVLSSSSSLAVVPSVSSIKMESSVASVTTGPSISSVASISLESSVILSPDGSSTVSSTPASTSSVALGQDLSNDNVLIQTDPTTGTTFAEFKPDADTLSVALTIPITGTPMDILQRLVFSLSNDGYYLPKLLRRQDPPGCYFRVFYGDEEVFKIKSADLLFEYEQFMSNAILPDSTDTTITFNQTCDDVRAFPTLRLANISVLYDGAIGGSSSMSLSSISATMMSSVYASDSSATISASSIIGFPSSSDIASISGYVSGSLISSATSGASLMGSASGNLSVSSSFGVSSTYLGTLIGVSSGSSSQVSSTRSTSGSARRTITVTRSTCAPRSVRTIFSTVTATSCPLTCPMSSSQSLRPTSSNSCLSTLSGSLCYDCGLTPTVVIDTCVSTSSSASSTSSARPGTTNQPACPAEEQGRVYVDTRGKLYAVYCGLSYADPDIGEYVLTPPVKKRALLDIPGRIHVASFVDCIAACDDYNLINFKSGMPCKGVTFLRGGTVPNCRLKSSVNQPRPDAMADSARLLTYDPPPGNETVTVTATPSTMTGGGSGPTVTVSGGNGGPGTGPGTGPGGTVTVTVTTGTGPGGVITVTQGTGPGTGPGGVVTATQGTGPGNGPGTGVVTVTQGTGPGTGPGGVITVTQGTGPGEGPGAGLVTITQGTGPGGVITVTQGTGPGTGPGGVVTVTQGTGPGEGPGTSLVTITQGNGPGGVITVTQGTGPGTGPGGVVTVTQGTGPGGVITVTQGTGFGSITATETVLTVSTSVSTTTLTRTTTETSISTVSTTRLSTIISTSVSVSQYTTTISGSSVTLYSSVTVPTTIVSTNVQTSPVTVIQTSIITSQQVTSVPVTVTAPGQTVTVGGGGTGGGVVTVTVGTGGGGGVVTVTITPSTTRKPFLCYSTSMHFFRKRSQETSTVRLLKRQMNEEDRRALRGMQWM